MRHIGLGTDHRGYVHKEFIKQAMQDIEWHDVGCFSTIRCDYPPFAREVVKDLQEKRIQYGVLLCGSGIGMCIAANRFPGIYAGVVWNEHVARMAKEDDNVNVLVIPADFVSPQESVACILAWLEAKFKGGRYQERLSMIEKLL